MFSLKDKHTLALDSYCQQLILLHSVDEVAKLPKLSQEVLILGAGSNIGFIDDFEGQVISFVGQKINIIEKDDVWLVEADGGVNWHYLVEHLIKNGIPGLENLALIPGNCGAAPVQNIGAYGSEFSHFCHKVHALDICTREEIVLQNSECKFAYRNSMFKQRGKSKLLITKIVLKLPKLWTANLAYSGLTSMPVDVTAIEVMNKVIEIRQSKLPDPLVLPNAGSFFKNPIIDRLQAESLRQNNSDIPLYPAENDKVKLSAGWLIEKAGFKGKQLGRIGTYEEHALVLVNHGGATGNELLQFVSLIRNKVQVMFGVTLDNEVLLVGKDGVVTL